MHPLPCLSLARRYSCGRRGFSLIELLSVLAIMSVLVGLGIASIPGMMSTFKRKGAVDIVMTTIEEARVAALRSGESVYVVLAKPADGTPDAIIVAGDQPLGSTVSGLVFYTPWIRLPQNIRFRTYTNTLGSVSPQLSTTQALTPAMLPPIGGSPTLSSFTFNSMGMVSYPASNAGPNGGFLLALYEGTRGSHGVETARGASARATQNLGGAGMYDVIRLSQYTGRSWMDVSSLLQ